MKFKKTHKSVLFLGAGGGNDIFSDFLPKLQLWSYGWRWDFAGIAGMLSPFHRHTVQETDIEGVGRILPQSQRFLLNRGEEREISFVDATVSKLVAHRSRIKDVFGLSLERGTRGLTHAFKELAKRYSYIVLVDVGGDIMYAGERDTHVLSPMFDAMVLRAFVDADVPGCLFEAGPGTDGELTIEALRESLTNCHAEMNPLASSCVHRLDGLHKRHIEPVRPGRTVQMLVRAYESRAATIQEIYRARAQLGKLRRYENFNHEISTELCRHFYLIDPKRIVNPFAVACHSPYNWFVQTQVKQRHTNNEANLQFFYRDGELYQLMTPSPLFPADVRRELLEGCLTGLLASSCDVGLMLASDWNELQPHWMSRIEPIQKDGMIWLYARSAED